MKNFTTKTLRLLRVSLVSAMLALFPRISIYADNCSPPGANASAARDGILTCGNPTETLIGSSPTAGVTYHWAGPDGFESGLQEQIISIPGTYTLTVTNPVDNCQSTATIEITEDKVQPDAFIDKPDTLNCLTTSVTLKGSTNINPAEYYWIGPGDTASGQNLVTTQKGGYTLIVTDPDNRCASTAAVYVEEDVQPPLASAFVSGELTCTVTSVELTSSSPTTGVQYEWSGPNNFSFIGQNTTTAEGGDYTVTVTDPTNHCPSTSTVKVVVNRDKPGAHINADPKEITCIDVNSTLYASSSFPSVTYKWEGPGGFSETVQNPVVATPGEYILTVTRPGNGCESTATFELIENKKTPVATATVNDTLNCVNEKVTLYGSSNPSDVSYYWRGRGFNSEEQNPTVVNAGPYGLTVTDLTNGCISSTRTSVVENKTLPASVEASNDGPITCNNDTVYLTGSSTTPGALYHWTGPGLDTHEQNPYVLIADTFTLTVTEPTSKCEVTATTVVEEDKTLPTGVEATNDGDLTCTVDKTTLRGSSTTPGALYHWTGPNLDTDEQNPSVSDTGIFTLTVTHPVSGCTVKANTTVGIDTAAPKDVSASHDGDINCKKETAKLSGKPSIPNGIYKWTGPNGFTSDLQNPVVADSGTYFLTVTDPVNLCFNTASTTLKLDTIKPKGVVAANFGKITCLNDTVTLEASTSTLGVDFHWIGPDLDTTEQNPVVTQPGIYILTVTNPKNKCFVTTSTEVVEDKMKPEGVHATNDGPITCSRKKVRLTGGSLTDSVSYRWTGPNGYTSDSLSPMVSDSGLYILTVTDTTNGCSDTASTIVEKDDNLPADVWAKNNGPLYCNKVEVDLTSGSSVGGLSFSWTGPNGYTADGPVAKTSNKGEYTVTATDPSSGCFVQATTYVDQDTASPEGVLATNNGPLTCIVDEVTLKSSSTTPGVSHSWTGPDNFTSQDSIVITKVEGPYQVIITNPINGCKDSAKTVVEKYITEPGAEATVDGKFTCDNDSLRLNGASPTDHVTYRWTSIKGFSSAEQNPVITVHDTYTVTVTSDSNGCESTSSITTELDTVSPGVVANDPKKITCSDTYTNLQSNSPTTGVDYIWKGPKNYYSTEQNAVTTEAGKYYVMARNPENGCTSTDSLEVVKDTVAPTAQVNVPDTIKCSPDEVELKGSSDLADAEYRWNGPGNLEMYNDTISVSTPGKYWLTVTNTTNGCFDTDSVEVIENKELPKNVSIKATSKINCKNREVTLTGSSTTPNVDYTWSGPGLNSDNQSVQVSQSGWYNLTVKDRNNNCSANSSFNLEEDLVQPAGIKTNLPGKLTCVNQDVEISASSTTAGVEFSWAGPDSIKLNGPIHKVSKGGDYIVTITDPNNGCFVERTLTVKQDTTSPKDVSASVNGKLNCKTNVVTLTGNCSAPADAEYKWTTQGGLSLTGKNQSVTIPDEYTLTVTDPGNGCTQKRIVDVLIDTIKPKDVAATKSGDFDCYENPVILTGSSKTPGVKYKWIDPTGYEEEIQNFEAFAPGKHVLTVTNPVNECSATASIYVDEKLEKPDVTTKGATIDCNNSSVSITASSKTAGVSYTWTGKGIEVDKKNDQNQTVSVVDNYTVTVFNPANGCSSPATTVVVDIDTTSPNLSASDDGMLTCSKREAELTASSTTADAVVSWVGYPGNPLTVTKPDEYTALAQDLSNGCTTKKVVKLEQDTVSPELTLEASDNLLTCDVDTITLKASSTTPNTTITWSGKSEGLDSIKVVTSGIYYATAKNTVNGCTTISFVDISQDISVPEGVTATNTGPITCDSSMIHLIGNSTTEGVSYEWTTTDPFFGVTTVAKTRVAKVSMTGEYTLVVKKNSSGCTSSSITNVGVETTTPLGVKATNTGPITCKTHSIDLIGSTTSTEDVSYEWTTTDPFSGVTTVVADTRVAQVDFPGIYTLVVRFNSNGCTNTDNTTVTADQLQPKSEIIEPSSPPVQNEVDTLRAVVQSGISYEWSLVGTDWSIKEGATSPELIYTAGPANTTATFTLVTRYDDNGCTTTSQPLTLTAEAAKNAESFALMNIEDDIQVSAYPNPFEDHALIEFTSKKDDYVTVSLFNLNGQLVKTLFESDVVGQTLYQVPIDGTNLQQGTYYYTVQTKDKVYTETIFLVR